MRCILAKDFSFFHSLSLCLSLSPPLSLSLSRGISISSLMYSSLACRFAPNMVNSGSKSAWVKKAMGKFESRIKFAPRDLTGAVRFRVNGTPQSSSVSIVEIRGRFKSASTMPSVCVLAERSDNYAMLHSANSATRFSLRFENMELGLWAAVSRNHDS